MDQNEIASNIVNYKCIILDLYIYSYIATTVEAVKYPTAKPLFAIRAK